MKFYSLDTEINFKQKELDNKRFKPKEETYDWYAIVGLIILIIFGIYEGINEKKLRGLTKCIWGLVFIYPIIKKYYLQIFVFDNSKYIKYSSITSITKADLPNNVETEVTLTLKNKKK